MSAPCGRRRCSARPAVKKRVYIIDEVHMLSTSAFNALLKILEEPPEHLMFILATTELQKVPATILSRCQRHSFKRIDAPTIAAYLEYIAGREGFTLTRDAAELIARLADGGVRDALSLLDQCSASETIDLDAVYSAMGLAGNRRTASLLDRILDHQIRRRRSGLQRHVDGRKGPGHAAHGAYRAFARHADDEGRPQGRGQPHFRRL